MTAGEGVGCSCKHHHYTRKWVVGGDRTRPQAGVVVSIQEETELCMAEDVLVNNPRGVEN